METLRRTKKYLLLDSSSRKHNWLMPSAFPVSQGGQIIYCSARSSPPLRRNRGPQARTERFAGQDLAAGRHYFQASL